MLFDSPPPQKHFFLQVVPGREAVHPTATPGGERYISHRGPQANAQGREGHPPWFITGFIIIYLPRLLVHYYILGGKAKTNEPRGGRTPKSSQIRVEMNQVHFLGGARLPPSWGPPI